MIVVEAQSSCDNFQLGRRDRLAGSMAAPHRHPNVEFNLVITGTASYLLDGQRYELRPRTLVWLFPSQDHIMANRSADYSDWLGLFTQSELSATCTTPRTRVLLDPDPPGHFARQLTAAAAAQLMALFEHVARHKNGDAADAGLRHAVLAAWEAFQAADEVAIGTPLHPAVSAAAQLLRADDTGGLTVAAVAHKVGLSPNHLSRLFHDQMGLSIARFRNEQRFRRFLDIYQADGQTSMLDAALAAGFGSYAQFFRVFSQLTGSSPSAYLEGRRT